MTSVTIGVVRDLRFPARKDFVNAGGNGGRPDRPHHLTCAPPTLSAKGIVSPAGIAMDAKDHPFLGPAALHDAQRDRRHGVLLASRSFSLFLPTRGFGVRQEIFPYV